MKKNIAITLALIGALSLPTTIYANDNINACDPTAECEESKTKTTEEGFVEISMDEALTYFTEKKSGILFFGFNACPWCKEARPILKKVADKKNVTVYYVKVRDEDKNLLYSDEQRVELTKYIPKYMSKNKKEDNKLWLYVPLVIHVKKGKAVAGHEGTVKNHDATKRKMTKKEKKKLEKTYTKILK
ncbi:conjugal transfer protein TraF [Absicoccus intestinalis]|uniref:Conjugal transfer protein TraF n=1 Tax=Absicoccus intestinalis TaxID=2926319 RepID=A0ABU4WK04_9FIRM|nr:conjugal transfer protein TraF [Absicoccus sp. CLA-KB-P134]MDX8416884.1 conjugal transfer protein TraF [Absicoccus sp. CLA-KB-P134]